MYLLISKVFTIGKNYYPQVFLKKCKYVIKEKKFKYIFDDTEIFSDSDYEKSPDYKENSNEEILEKIQAVKNSDEEYSDQEN